MKKLLTIALGTLSLFTISCSNNAKSEYSEKKAIAETKGQECLTEARKALEKDDFESARTTIEHMRKDFPLALNAREEGILLLDSINLFEAEAQLKQVNELLRDSTNAKHDSLQIEFDDLFQKSKFYKRKLDHDKQERKTH